MARKSRGRQKINMVKMENESNLQVTFSKRRSGLFKKASELCTLCGTEMALIVFSPGNKVFSFGHPSVEAVLDRFLSGNPNPNPNPNPPMVERALVEAHRSAKVRELNGRLTEVMGMVEEERKVGREGRPWWEGEVEEMGLEQLEELKGAMVELKRDVANQVEKMIMASMDHQVEASARVLPFFAAAAAGGGFGGYGVVPFAGGGGGGAGGSSSCSGGDGGTLKLPPPPPLGTHWFNHGFF